MADSPETRGGHAPRFRNGRPFSIRPAQPEDYPALGAAYERSVRLNALHRLIYGAAAGEAERARIQAQRIARSMAAAIPVPVSSSAGTATSTSTGTSTTSSRGSPGGQAPVQEHSLGTQVLQAVDDLSGAVLGYILWRYMCNDGSELLRLQDSGHPDRPDAPAAPDASDVPGAAGQGIPGGAGAPGTPAPAPAPPTPSPAPSLLDDILRFSAEMQDADLRHTPHLYLNHLYVVPEAQGAGVGTALVARCVAAADALGLPAYVSATPDACSLYRRAGFVETRHRDLDLARYVAAPGPGQRLAGYGVYRETNFLRAPRGVRGSTTT